MTLIQRDQPVFHQTARAKEVYDVTGAGDTVISLLAAGLSAGLTLEDSTRLANIGAGIVVGKLGTAYVSVEELEAEISEEPIFKKGILPLQDLQQVLQQVRREGLKVVATNGCFDILHPGHVDYLRRARELGDYLVVLVNTDDSVRRLNKGPERPINPLDHRMVMLEALACVDWVVPFDEDTPRELIGQILPDILVKGGDYTAIEQIAGHDHVLQNGGDVRILPFLDGYSTTAMIQKILKSDAPQTAS
jgi:D-beta-D-heptose 7-phosphate kinase/D-beta-D-heptose 1-phosphate adenosyltransferase